MYIPVFTPQSTNRIFTFTKQIEYLHLQTLSIPSLFSPYKSPSQAKLLCCHYRSDFPFSEFHINVVIHFSIFCVCLLLLSIKLVRFILVACTIACSFSLLSDIPLYEHTTFCLSIHMLMHTWIIFTSGIL